jgi:sugar lactone lactonase YvrE
MIQRFRLSLRLNAIFAECLLCVALAACGGGGGGNAGNGGGSPTPTPPVTTPPALTVFAGPDGGTGSADGTGSAARFSSPAGIATDAQGNVYVADFLNCAIRKITPAGVVTTIAGVPGSCSIVDGPKATARVFLPVGVAVDAAGDVYFAEAQTVRVIAPNGTVSTLAGLPPPYGVPSGGNGNNDGTGSAAHFYQIANITMDGAGNLYVTDSTCPPPEGCISNGTTASTNLRMITPAGVVTTIGTDTRFNSGNNGIDADAAGNIYIADSGDGLILKRSLNGTVTTVASVPHAGVLHQFGVTLGPNGNLYVTDSPDNIVLMIAAGGAVTTIAGTTGTSGDADGIGAAARFDSPQGIAADPFGNVYVADVNSNTIRKITSAGAVTTLAGDAGITGAMDGVGNAALFSGARGVAVDASGNLYIADHGNGTIRKITPGAVVSTLAGTAGILAGQAIFGGAPPVDGPGAAATFCGPEGVAVDKLGNVFVTDDCQTIRKIDPSGNVTTIAGNPQISGSTDGTGAAASFSGLAGIAIDAAGNLYVGDIKYTFGVFGGMFPSGASIRKIAPGGVVSTLAGSQNTLGSADGTGAAAQFDLPGGIAVDSQGNLYVADSVNCTIRKINPNGTVANIAGAQVPAGIVTTFAGAVGQCSSTDGAPGAARFAGPGGIAIDSVGNLYVVDGLSTIRKVAPDGTTTTVAGNASLPGLELAAQPGTYFVPTGIAVIDDHTLASTAGINVLKLALP